MKKVFMGLVLGFLVSLFAVSNSSAERCGCMEGMDDHAPMMHGMKHDGKGMMERGRHMMRLLMKLDLDARQKEAIREIKSRVMKDTIKKRAELKVARVELGDILHKETVDLAAAEAKLKQMESLRTDIRLSHIKAMEEIKGKLTPEQRNKFKELLMKQKSGDHDCMGMHRRGGKEGKLKGAEHMHDR